MPRSYPDRSRPNDGGSSRRGCPCRPVRKAGDAGLWSRPQKWQRISRPMIPWTRIASATVPQDAGELRLMKRGAEFSIMLGATELMNSRRTGSERALGTIGCRKIRDAPHAAVLVGGLGMGFTLRAVLAELNAGVHGHRRGAGACRGGMGTGPHGRALRQLPRGSARRRSRGGRRRHHKAQPVGLRCDPARRRQWSGRPDAGRQRSPLRPRRIGTRLARLAPERACWRSGLPPATRPSPAGCGKPASASTSSRCALPANAAPAT